MSDRSELIRRRAYQMWEEQGRPEGLDADHWYAAEQELAEDAGNEGEGSQTGAPNNNRNTTRFAQSGNAAQTAAGAVGPETEALRKEAGKDRSRAEDPPLSKS
jgi:hypothetical protein